MSVASFEESDLEPPVWIQCGDCEKWRNLPTEYILAVRDGSWNCREPGSGCSCAEACHGCSGTTCTCTTSGCWQDSTDPDKCAFAFGANVPTGFTQLVKQKPAGDMYVEYNVHCLRCNVQAILDRGPETLRDKEQMLLSGKGNGRALECWLRDHQGCSADWNKLTPKSLSFSVPLGPRRFRNTKSPMYIPSARATSASSQSAVSDPSTAVTASAPSAACLTHPTHASGPDIILTNDSQHTALQQGPVPASLVLKEEDNSKGMPAPADSVGNAPAAPARLGKPVAGPASTFAAQGLPATLSEDLHTATPDVKKAKPAAQSASVLNSRPCQGQALLKRKIFHPPFCQTSAQLCTRVSGNTDGCATCAAGNEHVCSSAGASVTTFKQIVTPSDSGEAVQTSAPADSVPARCLQGQASQCGTAKRALPGDLPTPRGLNGLLLSMSQKRKAASIQLPSSEPQVAVIDLTVSDDDNADTKRVKAEALEHAHGDTDQVDSLALMVQEVNRSLAGNPITMEQLQRLQDAVDGVCELKVLQPQELTHVLTSVGSLETVQKIFVRQYLKRM